jgi:alkylglycerol monooxygenase
MGQAIVYATPVFILLMAIELAWGWHLQRQGKGKNTYRLADAINSLSLGMMSQFTAVFTRLLRLGIYTFIYTSVSLVPPEAAKAFWNTWYGWCLALVFYDFCYYWLHRAGHETAIFWAAHVVHHQSQDYNLSTALRQTSSGALLGWLFYIPMALAGVPPLVFGIVALVDLLYQFWVHTEHVPKLGWFDRWFCSPSNHRVHHAVNDAYLDKNYGGIWMVWDRMFGSFKDEDLAEPCVYGTRSPLQSWDPLWANLEGYASMCQDAWHAQSWADKLRVFYKPPGWRPADVAARFPKPAFDMADARHKFEVPISPAAKALAIAVLLAMLQCVGLFLWFADRMPMAGWAWGVALLGATIWVQGALLQRRVSVGVAFSLFVLLAAMAALSPMAQWLSFAQYNQEFFRLSR